MFLNNLISSRNNLAWTIFHIVLAVLCTITPYALIVWFYVILLSNITEALNGLLKGNYFYFVAFLFYLIAFEMLGRMSRAAPWVPTELGKYLMVFFMFVGLVFKGARSRIGLVMVFILLPGLFYDFSGKRIIIDLINNFLGPLAGALGIALLYRAPLKQTQMNQILHLIWFACLSALVFTFIRTPDLSSIEFDLEAQFATTADTSSNQVSTILGLGMFLTFYSISNRLNFSGLYILDVAFLLLFAFQGLLSFSRGGMLIAGVGMVIIFFFNNRSNLKGNKSRVFIGSIAAVFGLYIIFQIADDITGGNLTLRYSGETQGTLLGSKEKSADVLVSGRFTIMMEDFMVWLEYPLTGVGAASSRYMRDLTQFVSPHIEFSRLLADHGILGLLFFVLLLIVFRRAYLGLSVNVNKGLFVALFVIALLTTFHAAMRTFVSPVFFTLASMLVVPDKNRLKLKNENYIRRSRK